MARKLFLDHPLNNKVVMIDWRQSPAKIIKFYADNGISGVVDVSYERGPMIEDCIGLSGGIFGSWFSKANSGMDREVINLPEKYLS